MIEEMITGLVSAGKEEILPLAYIIASLVFEKQDDLHWLKERFAMLEKIFQDSWAYQDIFQKGALQGRRQAVLDVIKARFPTVDMLVQEQVDKIVDLEILQDLLVKVSILERDIEVVQAVFMAAKADSKR